MSNLRELEHWNGWSPMNHFYPHLCYYSPVSRIIICYYTNVGIDDLWRDNIEYSLDAQLQWQDYHDTHASMPTLPWRYPEVDICSGIGRDKGGCDTNQAIIFPAFAGSRLVCFPGKMKQSGSCPAYCVLMVQVLPGKIRDGVGCVHREATACVEVN